MLKALALACNRQTGVSRDDRRHPEGQAPAGMAGRAGMAGPAGMFASKALWGYFSGVPMNFKDESKVR